jgi:hypothetical protein
MDYLFVLAIVSLGFIELCVFYEVAFIILILLFKLDKKLGDTKAVIAAILFTIVLFACVFPASLIFGTKMLSHSILLYR